MKICQDIYLVHENPAVVACEKPWNPIRNITNWPQANLGSQLRRPVRSNVVPAPQVFQFNGKQICAP